MSLIAANSRICFPLVNKNKLKITRDRGEKSETKRSSTLRHFFSLRYHRIRIHIVIRFISKRDLTVLLFFRSLSITLVFCAEYGVKSLESGALEPVWLTENVNRNYVFV